MVSGGRVIGRVASDFRGSGWLTAAVAVCLLLASVRPGAAQYREPVDPYRFFLDASVGGYERGIGGDVQFDSRFVWFGEIGAGRAVYPRRQRNFGPLVDIAGGLMVTEAFGAAITVSRVSSPEAVARLEVDLPHPSFLRAAATGSGVTGSLTSTETTVALTAVAVVSRSTRHEVRVWGGPAFITRTADLVRAVEYDQSADAASPAQTVTVTGGDTERASATAVGASLGADLTIFVTETFGVGAGVRYSRGVAVLDPEPMSGRRQELLVGGTLAVVGVRVRLSRDRR